MGIIVKPIDNRKLEAAIEKQLRKHVETLQFTGEKFVNDAREGGTYKDQTGNLRSSIGCAVARGGNLEKQFDGSVIMQGAEGKAKGTEFGQELIRGTPPHHIVLVGYAAMEYAAAVESTGRDVITWATKRAIKRIKYIMERVKK